MSHLVRRTKNLPCARFDAGVVASTAEAMLDHHQIEQNCMRCESSPGGYRLCSCCGILCCEPCCSNVIFELLKRRPVFICDHCFQHSSKIQNRHEQDVMLVIARQARQRAAQQERVRAGSAGGGRWSVGSASSMSSVGSAGGGRREEREGARGGGERRDITGGRMPSSSFDDEDNVRVSCFIEGRMGDPKSVEGNAVRVMVKAFTTEGEQWMEHKHASCMSDALLKNTSDFVDRLTSHFVTILTLDEAGDGVQEDDSDGLCRMIYYCVLRLVTAPIAARLVEYAIIDNAADDAVLRRICDAHAKDEAALAAHCGLDGADDSVGRRSVDSSVDGGCEGWRGRWRGRW